MEKNENMINAMENVENIASDVIENECVSVGKSKAAKVVGGIIGGAAIVVAVVTWWNRTKDQREAKADAKALARLEARGYKVELPTVAEDQESDSEEDSETEE